MNPPDISPTASPFTCLTWRGLVICLNGFPIPLMKNPSARLVLRRERKAENEREKERGAEEQTVFIRVG